MNLGGWQRLWVVLSIFLLILVGSMGWSVWPEIEDIQHKPEFYDRLSDAAKNQLALDANDRQLIRAPNGHVVPVSEGEQVRQSTEIVTEYLDILQNELQSQRTKLLIAFSLSWLSFIVILYGTGWIVGWVREGFGK